MGQKTRVAYTGFFHETNTYVTGAMGQTTLDRMRVFRGDSIKTLKGTAVGGPVDECEANGWELLPGALFFVDSTFGLVNEKAYKDAKQEILDTLKTQLPVDMVYLCVHGAGVVDKIPDLEGDLAESVRALVGARTLIIWSGDLHGKVTQKMTDNMDFVSACKEYPHMDMNACARDALRRGAAILAGTSRPTIAFRKVPLLMMMNSTEVEGTFAQRLKDKCKDIERRDGVLNCSVMHGFPLQDTDFCGMYPMVTTENDTELAERLVSELAAWIWAHREDSVLKLDSLDETLHKARSLLDEHGRFERRPTTYVGRSGHAPVVIADSGDNPGGGAPGDGTHLLRGILATEGLGRVAFISIFDPETAKAAVAAGVGATIDVRLGGKLDCPRSGEPIETKAYVKSISDGYEFVRGGTAYGIPYLLGPTVRLVIGDAVDVIVVSGLCQAYDDSQARPHGIIIDEYDVICVKSSNHFRAFYGHFTDKILTVDLPGLSSSALDSFEHSQLKDPIYPLDPHTQFSA